MCIIIIYIYIHTCICIHLSLYSTSDHKSNTVSLMLWLLNLGSFAQFARVLMVPSMYIIEALAYMTTLL